MKTNGLGRLIADFDTEDNSVLYVQVRFQRQPGQELLWKQMQLDWHSIVVGSISIKMAQILSSNRMKNTPSGCGLLTGSLILDQ